MRKKTWTRIQSGQLRDPFVLLACGFGSGLAPRMPGTVGTLPGVAFVLLLWNVPLVWRIGVVIALCALGIWLCGIAARRLGVHDHPNIVLDEIAGFALVFLFVPTADISSLATQIQFLLVGFVFFRVLDIWKPWPVSVVDRHLPGGWGIMLDDLLVGAITGIILWFASHYAILPVN